MTQASIVLTARDDTSRAFATLQGSLKDTGRRIEALNGTVQQFLGLAGVVAFTGGIKSAIDELDRLGDTAPKVGLTAQSLAELGYAAKLSGTDTAMLETAMGRLSLKMAEAAGGSKEAALLFQTLGIQIKTSSGALKGTDTMLAELANKFKGFADGPERTALAMEVFGKSGNKMIPLLLQGSEGIAGLREEFRKLAGDDISESVAISAQFNDNLDRLHASSLGFARTIIEAAGPALSEIISGFTSANEKGEKFNLVGEGLRIILETVAITGANVAYVFQTIGSNIGGLLALVTAEGSLKDSIYASMQADNEARRKALDSYEQRILKARELAKANATAASAGDGQAKKTAPVVTKPDPSAQKEYDQILASIEKRGALIRQELLLGRSLTDAEKFRLEVQEKITGSRSKLTEAQRLQLQLKLKELQADEDQREKLARRTKEMQAYYQQEQELQDELNADMVRRDQAFDQRLRQAMDYSRAVGESAQYAQVEAQYVHASDTVRAMALDKLALELNLQRQIRDIEADNLLNQEQRAELIAKLTETAQRDIAIAQSRTAVETYRRVYGEISDGLADATIDGLKHGAKSGAQSAIKIIEAEFESLVLRPIIKAYLQPVASSVTGLFGAGGSAGGGLAGAANTASGIGSLGNLASLSGSLGSGFGAGLNASLSGGFSTLGLSIEGGMAAIAEGTSASIAAGMGQIAGAVGPYALAAVAAYQLADKLFGSNGGPKTESGYGPGVDLRGDPASAKAISDSISAGYAQIAQTLGLAVKDLQVGVASAIDTAGDSLTQLQVVALQNGQEIYNRYTRLGGTPGAQENVGRTAEAYAQAVAEETARVMAAALANSELPQKFKDFLAAATDIPTAVQTVAQVAALDKRLAALGGPLKAVADLGVDAQLAFVNAAGGLDALDAATQRLMSAEEQRAYSIAKIQQQLSASGFAVSADAISSATAQSLREVLAGFDLTTEGGRRAANALLGVSGAILDLSASATSAQAAVRSAADILAERTGLEGQLYQLLGNTTVLRQRELDALDPGNRALQQHIYAVIDAQAAIESANTAYQQAQQAAQAQVSALESQRSAMASSVSQLQQDMQRWVGLRKQASGLLGQIGTSLGGPSTQEADLWAQLTGGAELEAQLQAAQELYGLITQRNSAETQAAQTALQNAQGLLDVGKQLRAYVQGLRVGDLTALTPAQALAEAAGQYQATLGRAQGGDTDAQRALQAQADTYLRLAREFDPEAYGSVFSGVSSQLDALGTTFMTDAQQQIALQQALVDAAGTANGLSADQLAKLQQLQGVVQGLYAQADGAATSTNAQLFVANANLASIDAQLTAARAAVEGVASGVDAAKAALVVAQTEAAEYLATYQGEIANSDPVPGLLAGLPGGIASALAPLINGTANVGGSAGGFDAGRAQTIRAYAATLSNDEAGAMAMYQAAVNNGVSSAELEAALNLPAGGANEWAKARGLPAFALGGIAGPGDALVGENGPEVVRFLQPAQVYRTGTGPSAPVDLQPLLAEMAALRAEVRSLREQNNAGHAINAQATERGSQLMGSALERGAKRSDRAARAATAGVPT